MGRVLWLILGTFLEVEGNFGFLRDGVWRGWGIEGFGKKCYGEWCVK